MCYVVVYASVPEVLTRNDQLKLKASRTSEAEAAEGCRKGRGRGRGKGKGGRGRGAKSGKGCKGGKASPKKRVGNGTGGAEGGDGVKTRAGPFKNKKRARAQKASPKKSPKAKGRKAKACKAWKVDDVCDEGAAELKRRKHRKASTRKVAVVAGPEKGSEAPGMEAAGKKRKASPKPKAAAKASAKASAKAKSTKDSDAADEEKRQHVRGRRGQKVVPAEGPGEGEPDATEYPKSFARRPCPRSPGSEAWHLWRIIVRVFIEKVAPKIHDRSRCRKEVRGFEVVRW